MDLARPKINKRLKWEPLKDEISDLYIVQKKDLREVMEMMEKYHQFLATEQQYRHQFKKWGFRKYVTKKILGDPRDIGIRLSIARKVADEVDSKPHLVTPRFGEQDAQRLLLE
ncbi:Clr5 domain-containing protein [Apiosordaria backusii]|uniref:Clr5 domain-containing protein n=1 Tax=Apiosordaria backusii TaxID=314023 RepID=A0AA40BN22_9PEZI|nr:Clr5 domain-containing protein [Apiosordaria backusii]